VANKFHIRLASGNHHDRLELISELVRRNIWFESFPYSPVKVYDAPEAPVSKADIFKIGEQLNASIFVNDRLEMSNGVDLTDYLP